MIESIQNLAPSRCSLSATDLPTDEPKQGSQTPLFQPADTVQISKQGRERLAAKIEAEAGLPGEAELDAGQQREVDGLKQSDQEVKAHERAHMAAGAGLVMGGANYQYQRGPDGKMYAVGGEVKIDTSPEKDPKDTIRKMEQVKRAALAPSQPSGQDRSVAAKASQIEAEARLELLQQNTAEEKPNASPQVKSSAAITAGIPRAYKSPPGEPTLNITA